MSGQIAHTDELGSCSQNVIFRLFADNAQLSAG